jgi:hypothetical protein
MSTIRSAANARDVVECSLQARTTLAEVIAAPCFRVPFVCRDRYGRIKWVDEFCNLVVTAGKNDLLDKYFKGSSYTAAWKLGLKGTGSAVAGDTLASHAGWSEVTPYAGNRPAIAFGTSSAGSNTATPIVFAITGSATVAGGFITDQASGTTGILYSAGDFANSRSVVASDTITVTPTVSV